MNIKKLEVSYSKKTNKQKHTTTVQTIWLNFPFPGHVYKADGFNFSFF